MPFFAKIKSNNESPHADAYVAGEKMVVNARIVVDEMHAIKKTLIEMKGKNNPFVQQDKLDELVVKHDTSKLPKELADILHQNLADPEVTARLQNMFIDKKSPGLQDKIIEIDGNLELVKSVNAVILEKEELFINDVQTKKYLGDADIATINKMKEVDAFIKHLIDSYKRIVPALKQNLEIAKANHQIAFLDSSIKQTEELIASFKMK